MKILPALLLLFSLPIHAQLRVIADLGGVDASPFFDAMTKQASSSDAALDTPSAIDQDESAMLPVNTPELSPGIVQDRALSLPGIGALFLIGDDAISRRWLEDNAAQLVQIQAAGMVVNVSTREALQALRALVPGVSMAPASGSELARRLQLSHYPVLIADTGLSQQVIP